MLSLYLSSLESQENKNKFTYIYENFNGLMFSVIFSILESNQDAEIALSDAYSKIIDRIDTIDTDNVIYTKHYVLRIAKNCAFDLLRDRSRQNKILQKYMAQKEEQFEKDIANEIEQKELSDNLMKEICQLPTIYRDIILARFYANLSIKTIAKHLDIPYSTAKSRLKRAEKILEKVLTEIDQDE